MAAAAAASLYPGLSAAAAAMRQDEIEHRPDPAAFARFDRDYRIFLEMHRQRKALDAFT
jgi:ribulose kinase